MRPKVSVVMSVYNGEKYLREAVDSILNQTFRDFEFIIVDDGSTDHTWAVLQSYDDPRIALLHNKENTGLTKSLNRGLAVARGEYIARMDADDISLPERFEQQVKALDENSRLGLVGSNFYVWFDVTGRRYTVKCPQTDVEIKWHLLFMNSFAHPSVMFRRQLIERTGCYDETLAFAQDYELFSRMAEYGEVGNLSRPLLVWRCSEEQISAVNREQQMAVVAMVSRRNIQRLLDRAGEHHDCPILESLWALWSASYPPLAGQSPERIIDCVEALFSIFCQQYRPVEHTGADFQRILVALRRSTLARLYFHTAIRYYRQGEMAAARTYFLKVLFSQPTAIKKWPAFGRLFLRALLGRRIFKALKKAKAIRLVL